MSVKDANIWKFSLFRGVKGVFKSTPRVQKCISISEEGIARLIEIPMATGWMTLVEDQLSWAVIHKLKVLIKTKEGVEDVLFICDRSYIPLDPAGVLTAEEKKRLIPLEEIASSKYDQAESTCQARTKILNAHKLLTSILYFSFAFTAIIVLVVMIKARVG
jgi:hypothetical protein